MQALRETDRTEGPGASAQAETEAPVSRRLSRVRPQCTAAEGEGVGLKMVGGQADRGEVLMGQEPTRLSTAAPTV